MLIPFLSRVSFDSCLRSLNHDLTSSRNHNQLSTEHCQLQLQYLICLDTTYRSKHAACGDKHDKRDLARFGLQGANSTKAEELGKFVHDEDLNRTRKQTRELGLSIVVV